MLGFVRALGVRSSMFGGEDAAEDAVGRATDAIQHGLVEAGYYEHTIYDDKGVEETYKRLREFADFALSV
jgi:alpha-acetolactate decarboxylase